MCVCVCVFVCARARVCVLGCVSIFALRLLHALFLFSHLKKTSCCIACNEFRPEDYEVLSILLSVPEPFDWQWFYYVRGSILF